VTAIDDKARVLGWVGAPKDEGAGSGEMALPDGRGRVRTRGFADQFLRECAYGNSVKASAPVLASIIPGPSLQVLV